MLDIVQCGYQNISKFSFQIEPTVVLDYCSSHHVVPFILCWCSRKVHKTNVTCIMIRELEHNDPSQQIS